LVTEATDNVEKTNIGQRTFDDKCTAKHSGNEHVSNNGKRTLWVVGCGLCVVGGVLWVVCRGLWVLCCGHGVSKWRQKSNNIEQKSVENLSKIDEHLVSGRPGTILGRGLRQGWSQDVSRTTVSENMSD
jgi:hypothetical protein